MNKQPKKKLSLSREVVTDLNQKQLGYVAGGGGSSTAIIECRCCSSLVR